MTTAKTALQGEHHDRSLHASHSPTGSTPDPVALIEALLFSGGISLGLQQLRELTDIDEAQLIEVIAQLNQQYFRQGRPYEIRRSDTAYRMLLRPQFSAVLRRLHGRSRTVRLSVAAIEVL